MSVPIAKLRSSVRWPARLLALLTAILSAGCASPWDQNFVRDAWSGAPVLAPLPPDAPVELRSAPWERVQAAEAELNSEIARSDTRPEEWSQEEVSKAKGSFLRGLQIAGDPSTVDLIGHANFRSTRLLRLDGPDASPLEAAARRRGADTVVWSRSLLGQTETIVNQPVTTRTTGDYTRIEPRSRRYRTEFYDESSTTWVPMRVTEDEYGYSAYFLARGRKAPASPISPPTH